jgi:hypothetical protein
MRIERTDISELGSLYLENVAGHNIDQLDEETPYETSKKPFAGEANDIEARMDEVSPNVEANLQQEKYFEIVEKYVSKLSTELVNSDLMGAQEAEQLGSYLYDTARSHDPFRWEDEQGETESDLGM